MNKLQSQREREREERVEEKFRKTKELKTVLAL